MSLTEFDQISVSGEGQTREPFNRWHERVREDIPHVPACVAEQWLYRHERYTPYTWLPVSRLRFELQTWELARILKLGINLTDSTPAILSDKEVVGCADNGTWVSQYMLAHGTWPVPIIVLDNAQGIKPPNDELIARWHLIEGHRRTDCLVDLAKKGLAKDSHQVWVLTVADSGAEEVPDHDSISLPNILECFRRARDTELWPGSLLDRVRQAHCLLVHLKPSELPRRNGARSRFVEICRRMEHLSALPSDDFTEAEARQIAGMISEICETLENIRSERFMEELNKGGYLVDQEGSR